MQASDYFAQISLDHFLEQLRLRGIAISLLELQRLQAVFATEPDLSRSELRDLLCSLLAKDAAQRRTISYLFEQFIPYSTDDNTATEHSTARHRQSIYLPSAEDGQTDENEAENTNTKPIVKRFTRWHLALATMVVLLITGLVALKMFNDKQQQDLEGKPLPPTLIPPTGAGKDKKPHQRTLKLAPYITLWTPKILAVEAYPVWRRSLPAILLLIGSGLGFVWLLQQALQRTRKREPTLLRISKRGRLWLPLSQKQPAYHLLSSEQRREMSWGIGRYLSEQPLNQLDIPRSVTASAKSGLPQLHFSAAQRERAVWLWQDRSSSNADLLRLADEITRTLRAVNIDCQQGYFHALPDKITNQHGEVIWSSAHEYPENQPLVVVLSDGDSLGRIRSLRHGRGYHSLRQLSHWQNLCFVDCSTQAGTLCQLLNDFSLECLPPEEIATWLAQQGRVAEKSTLSCPLDDLHRWAIACALPDRPLMEAEIRALHEALGLDCAWQYHRLQRYARIAAQGFDFNHSRHQLLHDFSQLALLNAQETRLDGGADFVQRTVHFWQQRYREIDSLLSKQETPRFTWKASQRQHQLTLDLALCELWQRDSLDKAANTLFDLHQHQGKFSLKREVERRLGHYTCLGWQEAEASKERIVLPYNWHTIDGKTQQQLKAAGFGGTAQQLAIGWNKTTGVLLGALAGLAVIALGVSINKMWPLFDPKPATIKVVPYSPQPSGYFTKQEGDQLLLGQRKTGVFEQVTAPKNATVHLLWHKQTAQAAQMDMTKEGDVELWRLGERQRSQRPSKEWFDISLAVIQASPKAAKAQVLAAKLLDSGTADQVIIGRKWKKTQAMLLKSLKPALNSQWLYINTAKQKANKGNSIAWWRNMSALLRSLNKPKRYTVEELGGEVLRGDPKLIKMEDSRIGQVIDLKHGMKLMPIPQGHFQMGSDNGRDNEKPVHKVTFNYDFWMSETEVTFTQYDAYATGKNKADDEGWGRKNRPVINVSWQDAQGYVRWLSKNNEQGLRCRLPSEAEWEYAARAGTTTDYFWGEKASHEYANYGKDECCGGLVKGRDQWLNTAPVGSFPANDFGLHDMNGNIDEWVQDGYDGYQDNYQGAPTDGSVWQQKASGGRVLRGGSWVNNSGDMRASVRDFNTPDGRGFNGGFRVVCALPFAVR